MKTLLKFVHGPVLHAAPRRVLTATVLWLTAVQAPAAPSPDSLTLLGALDAHDRAVHVKDGWIRDPYIVRGPDGIYHLTGTTPDPGDSRETNDPYNTGLGNGSIVGSAMRVWRSPNLVDWEDAGAPFTLRDTLHYREDPRNMEGKPLWAPELHWLGNRWALLHCPAALCSLALTEGPNLSGPWTHPMGENIGKRHDPSLFKDDDGSLWMIWGSGWIAPLKSDLSDFAADPVRIGPNGGDGKIGHEGCTVFKIHGKYVLFGTGWSTGKLRKGSYNLYYATADKITGPYGERKFAGRFLGHGSPFQDNGGRWWCTAFYNANVPPLPRQDIQSRDLSSDAHTINAQGVTLVPLEVTMEDGDLVIRALDPDYAHPGPDEADQLSPTATPGKDSVLQPSNHADLP